MRFAGYWKANLRVGEPPQLLFVGRFNPQKNAPLLIEALAQIARFVELVGAFGWSNRTPLSASRSKVKQAAARTPAGQRKPAGMGERQVS